MFDILSLNVLVQGRKVLHASLNEAIIILRRFFSIREMFLLLISFLPKVYAELCPSVPENYTAYPERPEGSQRG